MLIRSLSEEPSSIQINEPQLAVVLGRITLKSRMPLTKGIGDRMGAKKKCGCHKKVREGKRRVRRGREREGTRRD